MKHGASGTFTALAAPVGPVCSPAARHRRVGTDALLRQHLRQAAGEVLDGAFRRRVGEQDRVRHVGIHRRRIYDRAARLHVRNGRLGQVEHRVNVDFESRLPLLVADVADVLGG